MNQRMGSPALRGINVVYFLLQPHGHTDPSRVSRDTACGDVARIQTTHPHERCGSGGFSRPGRGPRDESTRVTCRNTARERTGLRVQQHLRHLSHAPPKRSPPRVRIAPGASLPRPPPSPPHSVHVNRKGRSSVAPPRVSGTVCGMPASHEAAQLRASLQSRAGGERDAESAPEDSELLSYPIL